MQMHTRMYKHLHMHAHAHMHVHMHVQALAVARALARTCTLMHTDMQTQSALCWMAQLSLSTAHLLSPATIK